MATQTLSDLAATLPPPTPAQVRAVFGAADPTSFAVVGRRFASAPILTDLSRLYGLAAAFWSGATPEQQDLLRGFSTALLSVAVHTALELDRALEAFERHEDHDRTHRAVTTADLGAAWSTAIRRRDLAVRALALVAGDDPAREALLAGATGDAEDADSLARGIDDLARLAETWIADPALADVVALARLDLRWAQGLRDIATALREAERAARSRMSVRVSQGQLDELDGRNLYLLKLVVDLFAEANDLDPTVPKLVPIAVARYFNPRKKKKAEASDASSTS
jgi:hypothetical protein